MRDLPVNYGPRTTCYNRFVRWRRAGVWDQIMDALATGHDAAVQMIDTLVVRLHRLNQIGSLRFRFGGMFAGGRLAAQDIR
jgi:transposase